MKACHRCGAAWDEPGQPGFNNTCGKCGMPLHACSNCRNFVSRGAIRCMLPAAPQILDPKAANRCTYFDFSLEAAAPVAAEAIQHSFLGAPRSLARDSAAARKRFNELFGET